jgi:hypothetical protein
MRHTNKFKRANLNLAMSVMKSLFMLASIVIAVACTKHKGTQNNVGPDPAVNKAEFANQTFHLVRGIEEADSDNNVEAVPGFSRDFGLVTVEITETELRLLTAFDPSGRQETAKVIASYPIKDHFDVINEKNDYDESTNKVVEDRKRPWSERQFMRVDWANPSNSMSKFVSQIDGTDVTETNTVLKEGLKNESGHYSWVVETGIQGKNLMRYLPPFGEDPVSAFRVTYRTHLMPVKSSDFKPVSYALKDFERFGFFVTQQDFHDPQQGFKDSQLKSYANIFNVCEPGRKESCSTNKITWVLSKDFPKQYIDVAVDVVKEWNQTFKQALGRSDDVVVIDIMTQVDISDPRYNIIAFYPARASGGLLGVAQWVSDPRTGELKSARATIYGDGINYELASVDTTIDIISSLEQGHDPLQEVFGVDPLGQVLKGNAPVESKTSPKQSYLAMRKSLSLDHARPQRYDYMTSMMNLAGVRANGAAASDSDPSFLRSSAVPLARLEKLQNEQPSLFKIPDMERINEIISSNNPNAASAQKSSLLSVDRLLKVGDRIRAEKKARLLQGATGIHGAELVDDAVMNYLQAKVSALQAQGDVKKLMSDNREQIKADIAKEIFRTTLLHEMGHTFGLRHNFMGSADKEHYYPEWKALNARIEAKDKHVSEADLAPYSYSSIMDYGADFFSQKGGLGPYDKAAIKYAYNRSVDRESSEFVDSNKKGLYKFCTDHQIGDDLLCRQFDKGSTISEVTENAIERFHRGWVFRHLRRDNAEFEEKAGGILDIDLMYAMLPARQVMDEFVYTIIKSKRDTVKKGECSMSFFRESINAGEMANVCDPASAKAAGVDPTDLSTFVNAIFGKDGKYLPGFERAGNLKPYQLADQLRANFVAQKFFVDVMSTVEPGEFLALPGDKEGDLATLIPLDMNLPDQEARMKRAATDLGISETLFPKFMAKYQGNIGTAGISRYAKPYTSEYKTEGTMVRLASVGSVLDKVAAIIALGLPDIGVQKYSIASLSGNPYLYPQSANYTTQLFNKIITSQVKTLELPVTLPNGTVVKGQADAASDSALQRQAVLYALTFLVSEADSSMAEKLRVCLAGQPGCAGTDNTAGIKATGASGGRTYVAVQSLEGDSIAYDLVASMKKTSDTRDQLVLRAKDPKKAHDDDIAILVGAADARARLVKAAKDLSDVTELQGVADDVADPKSAKGYAVIASAMNSSMDLDLDSFLSVAKAGLGDLRVAKDKVDAAVVAMGTSGLCDQVDATAKAACLATAEGARRAALSQASADLGSVADISVTAVTGELELKQAPALIKDNSDQLKSPESLIQMIQSVLFQLGQG